MKKYFLIVVLMFVTLFSYSAATKFTKGELPKNIIILGQSSQIDKTVITAVDLNNNELILFYFDPGDGEYRCYRTGIICDLSKQNKYDSKSEPFKTNN